MTELCQLSLYPKILANAKYFKRLLEHLRNSAHRKYSKKLAISFSIIKPHVIHSSWDGNFHQTKTLQLTLTLSTLTLAPCHFWLFPTVKVTVKGKHFESIQDIQAAKTMQIKTQKKTLRTASENGI